MALLVGPKGKVVGVEHWKELTDLAVENIKRDGKVDMLTSGQIELVVGKGEVLTFT